MGKDPNQKSTAETAKVLTYGRNGSHGREDAYFIFFKKLTSVTPEVASEIVFSNFIKNYEEKGASTYFAFSFRRKLRVSPGHAIVLLPNKKHGMTLLDVLQQPIRQVQQNRGTRSEKQLACKWNYEQLKQRNYLPNMERLWIWLRMSRKASNFHHCQTWNKRVCTLSRSKKISGTVWNGYATKTRVLEIQMKNPQQHVGKMNFLTCHLVHQTYPSNSTFWKAKKW